MTSLHFPNNPVDSEGDMFNLLYFFGLKKKIKYLSLINIKYLNNFFSYYNYKTVCKHIFKIHLTKQVLKHNLLF